MRFSVGSCQRLLRARDRALQSVLNSRKGRELSVASRASNGSDGRTYVSPLVFSAVLIGSGVSFCAQSAAPSGDLSLFETQGGKEDVWRGLDGKEKVAQGLDEQSKEIDVDAIMRQLEDQDALIAASRSDLPTQLGKELAKAVEKGTDRGYIVKLLGTVARLSEKKSASSQLIGAEVPATIRKAFKSVGWRQPGDGFIAWLGDQFRSSKPPPTVDDEEQARKLTELGTKIVANLAKHLKDFTPLVESGMLGYLLEILKASKDVEARRNVLLILACLSSAEKTLVLQSYAGNVMLQFAEDESDPTSQWYATGGLRNLVKRSENHRQLVVMGAIPTLYAVMNSNNNFNAQALAATAVGELATSTYVRAEIIRVRMTDGNLFEELGKLLRVPNDNVKRAACKAIDTILSSVPSTDRSFPQIVSQLQKSDASLAIARLAQSNIATVVTAATSALYTIAGIDSLSERALEAGGARVIIASCNSLDPGIAGRALDALACISETESRQEYLVRASVLKMILSMRSTNSQITRPLTTTVANLARTEALRTEIAHEGGLSLLNAMLSSGNIDDMSKREALRALYNLSVHGLSRVMVVQYGSLQPVVSQIRSKDEVMRLLAVRTLSNLLENLEFTFKAFEAGAIGPLMSCAKEGGDLGCRAVLCISEFTNLRELHEEIVAQGGVELFADMIKRGRNSEEIGYAVLGICNLAATDAARVRIRESGAIGFLTSIASAHTFSNELAAVAQTGLNNLQKGEKTITHVLPVAPSPPM